MCVFIVLIHFPYIAVVKKKIKNSRRHRHGDTRPLCHRIESSSSVHYRCFSISYVYEDRNIVETKMKEKRENTFFPDALFAVWILSWIQVWLLSLKNRDFLPELFRHHPFQLEERKRERKRESERFYRGKIGFLPREEGEEKKWKGVISRSRRHARQRKLSLTKCTLQNSSTLFNVLRREVTSPRPVNMATHSINIFIPTDSLHGRRPWIVAVTSAKPKWSTRDDKTTTRRTDNEGESRGFSCARHTRDFQWRSQLCDKVHFARPTGWWRQYLPSFYPVGDSADIQSRNGGTRRRQRLSRVAGWKLNRRWWSSGPNNGIALRRLCNIDNTWFAEPRFIFEKSRGDKENVNKKNSLRKKLYANFN